MYRFAVSATLAGVLCGVAAAQDATQDASSDADQVIAAAIAAADQELTEAEMREYERQHESSRIPTKDLNDVPVPISVEDIRAGVLETEDSDPFEGFNRQMLAFNGGLDKYAIRPVAMGYKAVTPAYFRDRVSNVGGNLGEPVTFANLLLQGKPKGAASTLARFGVNTTLGLVGIWDPATSMGLEERDEDFGQTLGVWGVGSGPFIVLPVLGPTTPRDFSGRLVDRAIDPLTWIDDATGDDSNTGRTVNIATGVLGGLNARVKFEPQIQALNEQAEPYIALRDIYLSQREAAIRDGKLDDATIIEDLPDFDEFVE